MDDFETTNPVEGGALPSAEVEDQEESGAAKGFTQRFDELRVSGEEEDVGDPIENDGSPDVEQDELEEIERNGRRAKIPSWLKPELMMQADYTRKTQELADARRAFEAERMHSQQAGQAELSARATLTLIDKQIGQYSKVDWNDWHEREPFEAQKAFAQFQLLKDARTETQGYLGMVQKERAFKEQQETAALIEQGVAELARDINDWSPQTAAKLRDFGMQRYGFSDEDLDGIDDPRAVKVLHAAFLWDEHQKKQRLAQGHAAAQTTRPAAKVGGTSPKSGLDDRLSAEEWIRRRNEQLRRRG